MKGSRKFWFVKVKAFVKDFVEATSDLPLLPFPNLSILGNFHIWFKVHYLRHLMRCFMGNYDWKVNFGQSKIKAMNGKHKLDTFSSSWKMGKNMSARNVNNKIYL